jgi:hypothetical protein
VKTIRRALGLSLASLALPAQQALACAVCFSGRDESRIAYLLTTLFMTSIPLLALGVGIYWVVKKATAAEHDGPPRR